MEHNEEIDYHEIIKSLDRRRRELEADDVSVAEKVTRLETVARFIWFLGVAIVGVTCWVMWVQHSLAEAGKEMGQCEADLKTVNSFVKAVESKVDVRIAADDLLHLSLQNQITANTNELEARKPQVKQVQEMWFMKEHGISNKEEFQRKANEAAER